MRRSSALVILWAFLTASFLSAQEPAAEPAARKLILSDAKKLVVDALGADAKKAAAARAILESVRPEDRKFIAEAIKTMPFTPAGKKIDLKRSMWSDEMPLADSPLKKGKFHVQLPKGYDGKKPVPLLFRFHGSGDTAEAFAKNSQDPKGAQFLCITPEIPSESRTGWNEEGGFELVDKLFRYALENFNIDPDRVYLSGHSAGGAAAFYFSQVWPHRTAAFYAMARLYWAFDSMREPCMDTLRGIPGYFVVGLNDTAERVDGFRFAEKYYKEKNLEGVFNFVKGKGHDYQIEFHGKAYDFMAAKKRTAMPKEIRGLFFLYGNAQGVEPMILRRWWLVAGSRQYDYNGTVFHARIDKQEIAIDAPNLKHGEVLLADEMLDLDQPVIIKVNGKTVNDKPVERSVKFLLDGFIERRDRGQLYWNSVAF